MVLAEAAQAHEFRLICHCVKSAKYTVEDGVEISTFLSAALSGHRATEFLILFVINAEPYTRQ